jgi:flagellar biosynthesis protein FliQ
MNENQALATSFQQKRKAMKKNNLVFGIIAGMIVSVMMVFSVSRTYTTGDFAPSIVIGYTSMIVAFSLIFVGMRNYRDKFNNGVITFGQAFRTGLYITLIASTMYVVAWLIMYYAFVPDFMDKYSEYALRESAAAGEGPEKIEEVQTMRDLYRNPLMVILFTYMEILPVGLVISLISALILKKKDSALSATSLKQ